MIAAGCGREIRARPAGPERSGRPRFYYFTVDSHRTPPRGRARMNIGVDIKALFAGKAGIAAYIRNTLDRLQETDAVNRYFLFEKMPSAYRVTNPLWRKVLVPSRLPGTVWLMLAVPPRLPLYAIDVFWGPEQIVPCVLPAKAVMVSTVLDVAVRRCPRTMQTTNYLINRLFLKRSIGCSRTV